MTVIRDDDVMSVSVAPAPRETPRQTPRPRPQPPAGAGNPLTEMTARLLSIPLHEIYAALWRMGVMEVRG
ncbi:Rv1535 family protein [Mycobacterium sp. 94-17]|uniref:Rv1535 family protein n=1 Tax=Mycobacterium sp. 94-17 TaxID=2986147 RepID=UPI002D1F08CA|nr:Rv1535 family protein [Mycobacterium sp. 94-17]MEB4208257.1 Rv1535 family protein [Mycobacterium sp. 94-17]